ncbi:MAG: ATP-binding cassette domain-containing protein [Planctomycetaceae bacterium]|nr:ATP-binding cassette domain-containing protein [Planctomycetaceae bacterium]
MSVPALELKHVSCQFGNQKVLRDINLQVFPGETLVLIGESGCGKSVTSKLLGGMLEPTFGEVFWQDRNVAAIPPEEKMRQRLKIGYLFQSAALFDSMTVYENIAFGLHQNTDLKEKVVRDIVHSRIHDVGLTNDVGRKKPSELSGGMRKRVGLARALALAPEIIVYDEPTTGLDPVMSDVINELIITTRQRRPVISIIVTHDMHTVQKVADRVVMLYPIEKLQPGQSQIIFEGTPEQAFSSQDERVYSFVHGDATRRLQELATA